MMRRLELLNENSRPAFRAGRLLNLEAIRKRPRLPLPRRLGRGGGLGTNAYRAAGFQASATRIPLAVALHLVLQLTCVATTLDANVDNAGQVVQIGGIRRGEHTDRA